MNYKFYFHHGISFSQEVKIITRKFIGVISVDPSSHNNSISTTVLICARMD